MTAAQRNASSYIATTSDDKIEAVTDYGKCQDCGHPLQSHEFNHCTCELCPSMLSLAFHRRTLRAA